MNLIFKSSSKHKFTVIDGILKSNETFRASKDKDNNIIIYDVSEKIENNEYLEYPVENISFISIANSNLTIEKNLLSKPILNEDELTIKVLEDAKVSIRTSGYFIKNINLVIEDKSSVDIDKIQSNLCNCSIFKNSKLVVNNSDFNILILNSNDNSKITCNRTSAINLHKNISKQGVISGI